MKWAKKSKRASTALDIFVARDQTRFIPHLTFLMPQVSSLKVKIVEGRAIMTNLRLFLWATRQPFINKLVSRQTTRLAQPGWHIQAGTNRLAQPGWHNWNIHVVTTRLAQPGCHNQAGTFRLAQPGWHN